MKKTKAVYKFSNCGEPEKPEVLRCGFCHDSQQGQHGEIRREYSPEWRDFIPVCRKHSQFDGMIDGGPQQLKT